MSICIKKASATLASLGFKMGGDFVPINFGTMTAEYDNCLYLIGHF